MNDKMYVEVYQDNELKNTWKNQQDITMQLLNYFFKEKKSKKYNNFNIRIKDNGDDAIITIKTWFYNCNDEKSTTILKFYNIPMKYGWLDTFKINQLINEEVKEAL